LFCVVLVINLHCLQLLQPMVFSLSEVVPAHSRFLWPSFMGLKFRVSSRSAFCILDTIKRNINWNIDYKFDVDMPRQKKLNYIQRWRMNHKPVIIYLSLEEFNALKTLADNSGLSYRELIMNAVKDIKKLHDSLSQSILKHHAEEIDKIRKEYEDKITELKAEYEVKVEDIRREYQARVKVYRKRIEELEAKANELVNSSAKEAYDKGYKDGYQKGYADGKRDGYKIGLTKCFGRK